MKNQQTKKWYQSKMIWLAVVQGIAGIVTAVATEFPEIGGLAVVKSVMDIALRAVTKSPVTK